MSGYRWISEEQVERLKGMRGEGKEYRDLVALIGMQRLEVEGKTSKLKALPRADKVKRQNVQN